MTEEGNLIDLKPHPKKAYCAIIDMLLENLQLSNLQQSSNAASPIFLTESANTIVLRNVKSLNAPSPISVFPFSTVPEVGTAADILKIHYAHHYKYKGKGKGKGKNTTNFCNSYFSILQSPPLFLHCWHY